MNNKEIITGQGQRENTTFVQFSDKLLTPDSAMRDYYRKAYSKMEGYYFPDFPLIPLCLLSFGSVVSSISLIFESIPRLVFNIAGIVRPLPL